MAGHRAPGDRQLLPRQREATQTSPCSQAPLCQPQGHDSLMAGPGLIKTPGRLPVPCLCMQDSLPRATLPSGRSQNHPGHSLIGAQERGLSGYQPGLSPNPLMRFSTNLQGKSSHHLWSTLEDEKAQRGQETCLRPQSPLDRYWPPRGTLLCTKKPTRHVLSLI